MPIPHILSKTMHMVRSSHEERSTGTPASKTKHNRVTGTQVDIPLIIIICGSYQCVYSLPICEVVGALVLIYLYILVWHNVLFFVYLLFLYKWLKYTLIIRLKELLKGTINNFLLLLFSLNNLFIIFIFIE